MSPPSSAPLEFSSARCALCGEPRPEEALDEVGRCPDCRDRRERRLQVWPHLIASLIVVPFGAWVLVLEKSAFLPWYAWLLPLAAAYYLGFRIGREVVKGYLRWRRGV